MSGPSWLPAGVSAGDLLRELRDSRAAFHALVENSPLAVVALDAKHRVQVCNPAFEALFGYGQEEVLGRNLDELIAPPREIDSLEDLTRRVLDSQPVHKVGMRARRDGSLVHVEIRGVPLVVEGELIGVLGMYEDISRRIRSEEHAREAQKMEALGRLAGSVAHDFNNLLMIIRGYADLLLAALPADDPTRDHARQIDDAARRAGEVTGQMLAFSRREEGGIRAVDVAAEIGRLAPMLERLLGNGVQLQVDLPPEQAPILVDPSQFEQAVVNLATNALDAMPDGGRFRISGSTLEGDLVPGLRRDGELAASYFCLEFKDTGTGIEPAIRDRVFEPYVTTKERGKGTGLGLSMVYGMIERSNGAIWVESEPGRGTTMFLYLPVAETT